MVMTVSPVMLDYVRRAADTVKRWNTTLTVPDDADDARAASMIRSAFIRAAQVAAAFDGHPFYNDDNSWSHDGMRGVTRARILEELELSRRKDVSAGEEWGIMARVECGDMFFDVPIALDLDADAARNIVMRIEGTEARFVDVDLVGEAFPGESFNVFFHADNWATLREIALKGFLLMDDAMAFRRPVVWDLLRARLADLPPEAPTPFSDEEFYTRFAKSSRYDPSLMLSSRRMVESVARLVVDPITPEWGEWFPSIVDLLNAIGTAKPMDGLSIILNFSVQEPLAEQPDGRGEDARPAWRTVGYHNLVVCYGLHPLTAIHMLDLVRANATAFYDLPPGDDRRHVLIGASAIHDTMLSAHRVSTYGRTDAYDRVVEVPLVA